MNKRTGYSPETGEWAGHMVFAHKTEHKSQWSAIGSATMKNGCTAETLRKRVRQAEDGPGCRAGMTTSDPERLKPLERGQRKLKRARP